jgi:hypothetical protein
MRDLPSKLYNIDFKIWYIVAKAARLSFSAARRDMALKKHVLAAS